MNDKNAAARSTNHSPEEIRDFIVRNYPDLANARGMSIGLLGNIYRVVVTDGVHVNHTLKIDPRSIDEDRANSQSQKSKKALKATAASIRPKNLAPKRSAKQRTLLQEQEPDIER